MTYPPPRDEYEDWDRPMNKALRIVGALLFLVWLLALSLSCVRRGQVCIEASHGRVDPGWQRNDSIGASACVDVEPPGEPEQ